MSGPEREPWVRPVASLRDDIVREIEAAAEHGCDPSGKFDGIDAQGLADTLLIVVEAWRINGTAGQSVTPDFVARQILLAGRGSLARLNEAVNLIQRFGEQEYERGKGEGIEAAMYGAAPDDK